MAIIHKSWIVWVVALTRLRTTLTMMSPGSGPLGQAGHTMSLLTKCSLFLPRLRPGARKTRIILRAVTGIVSHDNHNGRYLWLVSDLPHWPLIGWCCPHVSLDNVDMHVTLSCLSLVTAQHHSLVSYPSPELWTCWLHSQIQTRDRGCGDGGYVGFTISLLLPPGRNRLGLTEQLGVSLLVELKTQWRILSLLSDGSILVLNKSHSKPLPPSYQAWLVVTFTTGAPPPVCRVSCHISLDVSLISCSPLPLRSELVHVCHPVIPSSLSAISFLLSSHSDLHWITRQDDKHHSVTQDIKILLKCIKW